MPTKILNLYDKDFYTTHTGPQFQEQAKADVKAQTMRGYKYKCSLMQKSSGTDFIELATVE